MTACDPRLRAASAYLPPPSFGPTGWQAELFPTGYSGMHKVKTGAWRDDTQRPIEVVSGQLDAEMQAFLDWFNRRGERDGLLRAGIAHLRFVTIHPFEDGIGRVARAIADQALAPSEDPGQRFYGMSSQIRKERSDNCDALERSQKGALDVTDWLVWFLDCFSRAIDGAGVACADVLRKAGFRQCYAREPFSKRQKTVLNRFLDGFEGKLTARKWAAISK